MGSWMVTLVSGVWTLSVTLRSLAMRATLCMFWRTTPPIVITRRRTLKLTSMAGLISPLFDCKNWFFFKCLFF